MGTRLGAELQRPSSRTMARGCKTVIGTVLALVIAARGDEFSVFQQRLCSAHLAVKPEHTNGMNSEAVIEAPITAFPGTASCPDGAMYELEMFEDEADPGHNVFVVTHTGGGDDDFYLDCDAKADENIQTIGLNCLGVDDESADHETPEEAMDNDDGDDQDG